MSIDESTPTISAVGRAAASREGHAARPTGQLEHAARADAREQASEEEGVLIVGALVFHVVDVGPGIDVGPCGHGRAHLVGEVAECR